MSGFMYFLYILLAIAILLVLVMIHEFGHYIAGKILGFKINEFSIGFGKALFSKTNKKGEKFSLRVFPLGGYCAFEGEGDDENNPKPGSFNSYAPWKRIIVFLAGVFMNFLTAVIFSLILLCTYGGLDLVQVKGYNSDYSSLSSIQTGDVIYEMGGKSIDIAYGSTYNELFDEQLSLALGYEKSNDGASVSDYKFSLKVRHSDGTYEQIDDMCFYEIVEKDSENKDIVKYTLGLELQYYKHTFVEALGRCWSYAFGLAWMVLKSLWMLITFQTSISAIGGPITAITTIASTAQANFGNLLVMIPLLSANLAIFNLLPIPALDGAHVVFTLIEWIRRKPINRKVENMIHTIGLIVLFAFVVIVDILHFVL